MGVVENNIKTKSSRRDSTSLRDNMIHDMYRDIINELGELGSAVSKSYIYEKIQAKTHLSIRTISYILNHTNKVKVFE